MGKIALIGTYPPRKCGIASFTLDLNESIKKAGKETWVVALNDGLHPYDYPCDVGIEIEQNEVSSYISAASLLNMKDVDVVLLQHEYGIFGGKHGTHILQLLKRLKVPVISTLHTILDNPSAEQKQVLQDICNLSSTVVSISQKGIDLLKSVYKIPGNKIVHIHHGVHEITGKDAVAFKTQLGIADKKLMLTFGLLSKNKGIEVAINALPDVIRQHPDLVYVVLGATHPHVLQQEGENYRHYLGKLVTKLGLEKHVMFIDSFVKNESLFEFLHACDIYVIPYLGVKQISSGTLIYTMGAGKPIISTPFWYASEMLDDNRGILFDFNDSQQLSHHINELLGDDEKRHAIEENALAFASKYYWPKVGMMYLAQVSKARERYQKEATVYQLNEAYDLRLHLPALNLNHLKTLTDDTGILQHARYNIPDRNHGYCIDDNSRALMLAIMIAEEIPAAGDVSRLTSVYLSFLDYALNTTNGKFRNFMSYDRQWLEDEGSEDSFGRTMWSLGYTVARSSFENYFHHANYLFGKGLETLDNVSHPRAISYVTLGLCYYVEKMGDEHGALTRLREISHALYAHFNHSIEDAEWPWHNELVSYANARIPQALLYAGSVLKDPKLLLRGQTLLDWLIKMQFENDVFSPIGNESWLTKHGKARFDQQPLEAHGMIDACLLAEKVLGDHQYADWAMKAFAWFTGKNDCMESLCDFTTGGCRDGLHPYGVNMNQGAESTLSWLMSLVSISNYKRHKKIVIAKYENQKTIHQNRTIGQAHALTAVHTGQPVAGGAHLVPDIFRGQGKKEGSA